MFDVKRVSAEIGGKEISFETGKLARQAGGAVVVKSGETLVLCTATVGNLRDVDFLPLTVDVEEKHYAAGKIPGSFFRREARSGEKATLTARMIDRPVRPLFPKGWHYETQIVCQPMSVDHVHPYDILAMNGASAALALSPVPLPTYVGAVRVGQARRRLRRQPRRGGARGARDGPDRLRFRRGDPDGRVRRRGRHRSRGPRRARHRPRRDQDARRDDERPARAGRQGQARGRGPEGRRGDRRAGPHRVRRRRSTKRPRSRASSSARTPSRRPSWRPSRRSLRTRSRSPRRRRSATRSRAPSRRSRRTRSASGSPSTRSGPTAAPPTRSGRSRPRSTSPRARTAPRCSPAVRPRSSRRSRWARPAWT